MWAAPWLLQWWGCGRGGEGASRVEGLGSSEEQVQKDRLWSGPLGKFLRRGEGLWPGRAAQLSAAHLLPKLLSLHSCPQVSGGGVRLSLRTRTRSLQCLPGEAETMGQTDLMRMSPSHRAGGTDTHPCPSTLQGNALSTKTPHARSPAAPAHTPSPAPPPYTQAD